MTATLTRLLVVLLSVLPVAHARAQAAQPEKPRVAVREIAASGPVLDAARAQGQSQALEQILAAADSQLTAALANTRRFDVVARADLRTVLREQDLAESGLLDPDDPQAARAYALAGVRYVVTVSVDNFQDAVARADFTGGLGDTTMERRTVQMLATLRIYDTSTAVLLETVPLTIEQSEVRETLPGARHEGRLTNALLGGVAERFARDAANAVLARLAPARVLAYTLGQITLNRAEGTGVEPGQIWRVYHAGRALVDPETGEHLGAEEVPVGWARITEVNPRFSKAQAIEDTGITVGSVLRLVPGGLPPGVDPNARAAGSHGAGAQGPAGAATPPARIDQGAQRGAEPEPDPNAAPLRVAVFVRNTSGRVPDRTTDAIETWVTSAVAGPGVEVIGRALVLNAVSQLSDAGANEGSPDPRSQDAARLLSDQSSALALARTLGADALLVATAVDLAESTQRFQDEDLGVDSDVTTTRLSLAWSLVSGRTGGAVAGGEAESTGRSRRSGRAGSTPPDLSELIRDAATQVGRQARRAALEGAGAATREVAETTIRVEVAVEDLSVPDIRMVDGAWVVTADRYLLRPSAWNVLIDGFLVGSAPGEVPVTPGPHRLRVEAPGLEPADRFIVARDGMALTIPMRLSEDGRRRWAEHAAFLEGLKDGAALRENERVAVEGIARFLAQSRLVVDTSALESVTVTPGVVSLWADLFDRRDGRDHEGRDR